MKACDVGPREENESRALRVLVVDDDEIFRALCTRYLRSAPASYEIFYASTGAEAAAQYDLGNVDCVLVDYQLPDMTGTVVMRNLQPEPDPRVPVIMLTGMSSEDVAIESLHAGVADYMSKDDVNPTSLHRAIRNAVEKAQLHRMLVDRNVQLEQANVSLSERNEQIQRFCHVMSHEMKTPLTAVREFVSLVLDGVVGDASGEQREVLSMAIDCCDELVCHFNDLIESVRIDTGKLELHKRRVGIVDQISRCIAVVSPIADRKKIVIGQKLADALPDLDIDAVRIRQVITNLLTNSVKFTDEGGLITVAARVENNRFVRVEVSDTGCGIPQSDLPFVFDRLHQAEQTNVPQASAGLGLGLSISRDIVERHGGTIGIQSRVGSGTTVGFELPVPQGEFESGGGESAVAQA